MTATIEAHGLEKRYRQDAALDGLDLVAERGQVTAVLGPNGAGKTTFVRARRDAAAARRGDAARARARRPPRARPRCAACSAWPASSRPSSRR